MVLAYASFFAAIAFSLLIPYLFGESIDRLVTVEDGKLLPTDIERGTLIVLGLALLGASMMRGVFDFARTYTTDSLSQKVAYDLRNDMYDRLQHLSFGFHDTEHTGNLMSKVTSDIEAIRRFVMMGLVRSFEVLVRVVAVITKADPLFVV